jgi:hypothetical protein
MQTSLSSSIVIGNKSISERQDRLCLVAEKILANPNMPIKQLREEIAVELFVTLRCALDYIHYAQLLINLFNRKV